VVRDAHAAPVLRLAPAKLNLTLAVVGRRADGYHDLHSVFVPLGLADRLSFAPLRAPAAADAAQTAGTAGTAGDTLHVEGHDPGPDRDNLVLRAIGAARTAVGAGPGRPPTPGLAVRLDKRIPVAAGLGGGSSDAAAALEGSLEAWGAELDPARRIALAASIGSDVPFFLAGGPALVEGRGERVTSLGGVRGVVGVLLVTPAVPLRTPDVFEAFAALAATRGRPQGAGDGSIRMSSEHLAAELRGGIAAADLVLRAGVLAAANDLRPAADLVLPELVPLRRAMMRTTGRPIGLAGSGPTLWALYPSEADASAAAELVRTAVEAGTIPSIGGSPPSVIATAIAPTLIGLTPRDVKEAPRP
jgi:4-diphosphocytidyl-2-C-methyl-D-erythritol kinase